MAGRQDIEAGRSFVRLYLKDDMTKALIKSLRSAGQAAQDLGASIAKVGAPIAAAGGAITAAMGAALTHFAAVGDQLDKMSLRTGVTGSALAELGFAAEQSGANIGSIESMIRKMQKTIGDAATGSKSQIEAFDQLGLSIESLQGLTPDQQFEAIGDAVGKIEDPTMRAAAAMDIFGRSGTELLPMLGSIKSLRQEARDLGIVPAQEEIANAAKVTDAINRVRRVSMAMLFDVGAALAEPVLSGMEAVKRVGVTVGRFVKENQGLIRSVAAVGAGLLAAGTAITAFGGAIVGIGVALSATATAVATLAGVAATAFAAIASPIGIATAAVIAGVAAWARYTESGQNAVAYIKGGLTSLLGTAREIFGAMFDAIAAGDLKLAGEIAMTGLRLVVLQGLSALSQAVGGIAGDVFGTIGQQMLGGDFAGAWQTAIDAMSMAWASFAESVVTTFTTAAEAVVNTWQRTVGAITDQILESAANGGIGQLALAGTGINLSQEQARAELADRQRRSNIQATQPALIAEIKAELEAARAAGDTEMVAVREKQLAAEEKTLRDAQRAPSTSFLDEVQAAARETIRGQADAMRQSLDRLATSARDRTDAATGRLSDRTQGGAAIDTSDLARRFDELAAMASERRASLAVASTDAASEPVAQGVQKARGMFELGPTFSAAAAVSAGFGGQNPQQQMAADIREQKRIAAEQLAIDRETLEATKQLTNETMQMRQGLVYA